MFCYKVQVGQEPWQFTGSLRRSAPCWHCSLAGSSLVAMAVLMSPISLRFLGRARAGRVDLGPEGRRLQGRADTWAMAPAVSSPASPRSPLHPSRRGHGPNLGLPASRLRGAAGSAAAATGYQQQQQRNGSWRVRGGRQKALETPRWEEKEHPPPSREAPSEVGVGRAFAQRSGFLVGSARGSDERC